MLSFSFELNPGRWTEVWAVEGKACQECFPVLVGTGGGPVIQSYCRLDLFV